MTRSKLAIRHLALLFAVACAPDAAPSGPASAARHGGAPVRVPIRRLITAPADGTWAFEAGFAAARLPAHPFATLQLGSMGARVSLAGAPRVGVVLTQVDGASPDLDSPTAGCVPGPHDAPCTPAALQKFGRALTWWTAEAEGFHQGFVLPAHPGGHRLELTFPGAHPTAITPDAVALDARGGAWRYAGLRAWDADGRSVPASFADADAPEAVALVVHHDGAVWIDPVLGPADWSTLSAGYDGIIDWSAAPAGDFDADGHPDLMVALGGAPWIYAGDGLGGLQPRSWLWGELGAAGAGRDMNAQPGDEAVSTIYNQVCVAAAGRGTDPHQVACHGVTEWDDIGFGVSVGLGDVNGDGYADAILGQAALYGDDSRTKGEVWWMPGGPDPAAWRVQGFASLGSEDTFFGYRVSTGLDLNQDGYDDVAVTEPACGNPAWEGGSAEDAEVRVYLGSPTGLVKPAAWRLSRVRAAEDDRCAGWDAQLVPDVDGDGFPDLVVSGVTTVQVFAGTAAGVADAPMWETTGVPGCGDAMDVVHGVGLGDVNGDGLGDLAIAERGKVRVHLGRPGGVVDTSAWEVAGMRCIDAGRAGDLNGDGRAEVVVIEPERVVDSGVPGYPNYGQAWLYLGAEVADLDGDGWDGAADCGPYDARIGPDAAEVGGDHVDQDCDGLDLCWADDDSDGTPGTPVPVDLTTVCADLGLSTDGPDCNDGDPALGPDSVEVAENDVDEDCDGQVLCYADGDEDGFGSAEPREVPGSSCSASPLRNLDRLDCDDTQPLVHPGGVEVAGNDLDDDCDGRVACRADGDGDGWGDPNTSVDSPDLSCRWPGMAPTDEDCDTANAAIHPEAAVTAGDMVDDDCDGRLECWEDLDGDLWGSDVVISKRSCDVAGASPKTGDCDDNWAGRHPGPPQAPGYPDYNCDGMVSCYVDGDGDNHAVTSEIVVEFLIQPGGYYCGSIGSGTASYVGDCDDSDPLRCIPYAGDCDEIPDNAVDEDCDNMIACRTKDVDGDGYGKPGRVAPRERRIPLGSDCASLPPVIADTDCNDDNATVYPGAFEVIGDRYDQDCDGQYSCYADLDGDGFAGRSVTTQSTSHCPLAVGPDWQVLPTDCADREARIHPGVDDLGGDGHDPNCDGVDGMTLTVTPDGPALWRIAVSNAPPGEVVALAYSLGGPGVGPCLPVLHGACVGLQAPKVALWWRADDAGQAGTSVQLPSALSGQPVWLQAWARGPEVRSSAVLPWTVP